MKPWGGSQIAWRESRVADITEAKGTTDCASEGEEEMVGREHGGKSKCLYSGYL